MNNIYLKNWELLKREARKLDKVTKPHVQTDISLGTEI